MDVNIQQDPSLIESKCQNPIGFQSQEYLDILFLCIHETTKNLPRENIIFAMLLTDSNKTRHILDFEKQKTKQVPLIIDIIANDMIVQLYGIVSMWWLPLT